ncbi:MAG TPA: ABC transporter permease [Gemmataceae bacterium]|nr:ABC transporter permease [Gemmataceae bacterium]
MPRNWHIVRTLLHKELLRHLANRGGLALAALLLVAAMVLSFFGRDDAPAGSLVGGVQYCFIDYWEDDPWIEHLRHNVPRELEGRVRFRPAATATTVNGILVYPPGTGAIQIRPRASDAGGPRYKVWFWHPGKDGAALAPFEAWFWRESYRYLQRTAVPERIDPEMRGGSADEDLEEERSPLDGGLEPRSAMATALVLFALFFGCVYLLPSLTGEERERGILLAQALSPASPGEILAAKFLFYLLLGLGLAALLAGICRPAALVRPFFWLALAVAALGALGIGLTIASLARTQRSASMGALCYTLGVSLLLLVCQQNNLWPVSYLALEYHCPRMLHAAMEGTIRAYHWGNLATAAVLALAWITAAVLLFRRRGWQ